jgi:hypothetical protein
VSVPAGGVASLVIVTTRKTLDVASAAVTVIVLTPITSGRFEITHAVPLIDDPPDVPALVLQFTAGEPLPPVTVPVSEIEAAVVVAGGAFTVKSSGGGATPVRVMVTTWETLEVASAAVTVIVLSPITSGRFEMTKSEPLMIDPSKAPTLVVQLTAGEPLPPVTVP